jgi:uncharacterized membrane protein (DUF106 family)
MTNRLVDLTIIPYSTFFILALSFFLSFITLLTNRLLTNIEQTKAWNQEIAAWRADSIKAARTGDKKLLAKVKKQQTQMLQLQSKIMSQQLKVSFIWTIPFMLLWLFYLSPMYAKVGPVAYLPGIGGEWSLNYVLWYFLCSMLFGPALLTHLLGLSMGGD